MPIYEYHCEQCDKKHELLISAGKADSAECPVCGSSQMRRLMSVFSSRVECSTPQQGKSCPGFASGACESCESYH